MSGGEFWFATSSSKFLTGESFLVGTLLLEEGVCGAGVFHSCASPFSFFFVLFLGRGESGGRIFHPQPGKFVE